MDKIINWLKWAVGETYGLTQIEVEENPAWKKVESILLGEIDKEWLKEKSLELSKLSYNIDSEIKEEDAKSFLFQFINDWLRSKGVIINKGVKP